MKIKSLHLSLLSLVVLAGCQSGPKINHEMDPEADLSQYQTYTVLPLPDKIPGGDPGVILKVRKEARDKVVDILNSKGYREVPAEQADFAVNLTGKIVPKTDVTDWGYTYPTGRGWYRSYPYYGAYGSNVTVDQYEEGTLIIEIYDVADKEMVWVGWGTGRRSSKGPDMEKLALTIEQILASFPLAAPGN